MPRRATKAPLSLRINAELLKRLDAYAARIGRNRSEIVDRAVEDYLARHSPDDAKPRQPK
ncbi:MAG TPA: ribbon-helix-helix domain-containing protein [Tepidisphaeraceae bacterium]|nr:ribbon-helix-helix domain-containing protein [Tepidisphaeraceae bacterium]